MIRWETHVHTTEGSACASAAAADMARGCKARGYDGMFVTDHFYHGNTSVDRSLPWAEWVRRFALGYYHAKETGDQIGLAVGFGWEYSWNGNDFLTYGLSPEWLQAHPEIITLPPCDCFKMVRASGGMIVHAHPFRQEWYVETIRLAPDLVDAVEVYNGGNRDEKYNERAEWYAESFGLPMVSGSDTHWSNMFVGGIITDQLLRDGADYKQLVQTGGICGLIRHEKDELFASAED